MVHLLLMKEHSSKDKSQLYFLLCIKGYWLCLFTKRF